jgi:hypothetical protein
MAIKKRTEIACILCKNIIKFPEYIGKDYDGDLFCDECESMISIKLKEGEVKAFKFKGRMEQRKGSKTLEELRDKVHRLKYGEQNDKGA